MAELGVFKRAGRKPERGIREKIRKEEGEKGRYMAVLRGIQGRGGSLKGDREKMKKEEGEKAEKMAELGGFKGAGRKPEMINRASLGGRPQ